MPVRKNGAAHESSAMQVIAAHVEASPLFNSSLAKGLAVLGAFGPERRTMNLPEIAAVTGVSKSAAQRLAFTLEQLGYLRKDLASRRYSLTSRIVELGMRYVQAHTLIDNANPYLLDLNIKCGETVNLSEPDGDEMVFVAWFPGHKQISVQLPVGGRYPMFCTAAGRAYLSGLNKTEADALVDSSTIVQYTPNTIVDPAILKDRIDQARRSGCAYAESEFFRGDINVAAPVFDIHGTAVAAVGISVPVTRWTSDKVRNQLAPLVLETARAISSPIVPKHSMAARRTARSG
ncbi:MAG: hypothetical protein QOK29_3479 [Rhodospirillaceae bacterium]|jgi:DNA-binding IclR family transcriptional regulator|nr:hypothetical protein [Rhodospirillaceae bacterium]